MSCPGFTAMNKALIEITCCESHVKEDQCQCVQVTQAVTQGLCLCHFDFHLVN